MVPAGEAASGRAGYDVKIEIEIGKSKLETRNAKFENTP
jgi:hypothetical protein